MRRLTAFLPSSSSRPHGDAVLLRLLVDRRNAGASPGRTPNSIADAWKRRTAFSTDVWSTIVVIAGIGLVWPGETWNLPWPELRRCVGGPDGCGRHLWVGAQLGRRTLDALLDAAPQGLQQEIAKTVARMDGVLDVDRVRVRRAGNRHFVDATVSVRDGKLEQVHALERRHRKNALARSFPQM